MPILRIVLLYYVHNHIVYEILYDTFHTMLFHCRYLFAGLDNQSSYLNDVLLYLYQFHIYHNADKYNYL